MAFRRKMFRNKKENENFFHIEKLLIHCMYVCVNDFQFQAVQFLGYNRTLKYFPCVKRKKAKSCQEYDEKLSSKISSNSFVFSEKLKLGQL